MFESYYAHVLHCCSGNRIHFQITEYTVDFSLLRVTLNGHSIPAGLVCLYMSFTTLVKLAKINNSKIQVYLNMDIILVMPASANTKYG